MKVRDIMTTDVATATPDSTLEDVAMMMRDEDTGAIPVLDGDQLVGIITDRDIVIRCIAEGKDAVETTVDDVLTEGLETVEPDADIEEARDLMSRRQIRRLPVVEDGELIGMLSIGDIAVKSESDVGDTLENVSEGVKASGTNRKGAQRAGSTRRGGDESSARNVGAARSGQRGAAATNNRANGREESMRTQGRSQPGGRGNLRGVGVTNSPREEQRRQGRVAPKRAEASGSKRRKVS